MNGTGKYVD